MAYSIFLLLTGLAAALVSLEMREHLIGSLREAESRVDLKATDAALFRAVQKRLLEDERLRHVAIDADVRRGVVELRGSVPDERTAAAAVEVARAVPGVMRVENRLNVAGAARPGED